jgi:hypothetical protein
VPLIWTRARASDSVRAMDLRPCGLSARQVERAARVLAYQPFLISDEMQTGVAYSWLDAADPRVSPPLLSRKAAWAAEWGRIDDANGRLRAVPGASVHFRRAVYHPNGGAARCGGGTMWWSPRRSFAISPIRSSSWPI